MSCSNSSSSGNSSNSCREVVIVIVKVDTKHIIENNNLIRYYRALK